MKHYPLLLALATLAFVLGVRVQPDRQTVFSREDHDSRRDAGAVQTQGVALAPLPQRSGSENGVIQPLPVAPPQSPPSEPPPAAVASPETVAKPQPVDPVRGREEARPLFELAAEQALAPLAETDLQVRRSILSRGAIRVDWNALAAVKEEVQNRGSGALEIATKEKGRLTAKIERVIPNWGGGYSLSGQLDGYPEGTFMATAHGDVLVASIRTGEGDFDVVLNRDGTQEIRHVDISMLPGCAGAPAPPAAAKAQNRAFPAASPPDVAEEPIMEEGPQAASDGDMTVIDVMVVYTASARGKLGGTSGTIASINQSINGANQAFSASQISASFRLAHAEEISYTETSDVLTDLFRLAYEDEEYYLEGVHALRNAYGADLVSLWTGRNYGGIGMMPGQLSTANERIAFNVCGVASSVTNMSLLFTHECGHNLGCNHDLANSGGPGLFPYSYGWSWTGSNGVRYRCVMAYESGQQTLRFSNPNVNHAGVPSGTSTADNARTINNSKETVAGFRDDRFISPGRRTVPAAGGGFSFAVTNLGGWAWHQSAGSDWVSSAEPASQNGNQTFSYTVAANPSTTPRSAKITVTGGSIVSTHTILQDGADHGGSIATATLIEPDSTTAGKIETAGDEDYFRIDVAGRGVLTVGTTGSTDTMGYLLDAAGAQLAADDDGGEYGNFQISHAVATGTYYVRVRAYANETGAYQLVSSFAPFGALAVYPADRSAPAAGGGHSFSVAALAGWSWSLSGGDGWVTSAEPVNQSGDQTFSYTLAANLSTVSRTATITVTDGALTATHTVTQDGADHGNSIATATLIDQDSTTAGSIETAGDNDYFRINVTGRGILTVGTAGSTDTMGYLLDAAGAQLAADDDGGDYYNFQISHAVTAGTYYVRVRAYDIDTGAYQLVSSFEPATPVLTLIRVVPEAVFSTPDRAGTLGLAASPAKNAGKLTKGPGPQTATVKPGTLVKVTAIAKTGHLFSHWEGLPSGALAAGNVAGFVMPNEDVPDLTAVFTANPFAASGSKLALRSLLLPDLATAPGNATVGLLTGTLVAAKGSLSGKVFMDGKTTSFTAVAQGDGSVWFKAGKSLRDSLPLQDNTVADKTLSMTWSEAGLQAAVTAPGDAVSAGLVQPALYSNKAGSYAPGALLNRSNGRQGHFTLALPAKVQSPPKDPAAYPQGMGYARLTLARAGTLKLAGALADGTKITASSFLVVGDESPIFIQLTTPGAKAGVKGGSFLGTLVFDTTDENNDVRSGGFSWFRPLAVTAGGKAQAYRAGWPEGILLDAVGALYHAAMPVQTALGLGDVDTTDSNAALVFVEGKLDPDVVVTAFNMDGNKVVKLDKKDKSFTLSVAAKTGLIKGTFTPNWLSPASKLPAFQGVLLQKGGNAGGWGFFLSNAARDLDSESGRVTLGAP